MATPPSGYAARPATRDDLGAVGKLARAVDVADWGEPTTADEEIADDWAIPGLNLATDTWLIWRGEELCAYAWLLARRSHCQLDGWGMVHPEHRGRGLRSFLLDLVEERAAQHAAMAPSGERVTHRNDVAASDQPAHELLQGRGFALVRHFWRMDTDLGPRASLEPTPPRGIAVRTFVRAQDEQAVHAAFEEAFAEHFGYVPRTLDEWVGQRIEEEGFDPSLWFLATEGGEVVGALSGKIIEHVGWVWTLGVRKQWRQRGIGEALLRHSFREFQRRGIGKSSLYVDAQNETGATALYERLGMHVATQFDFYEKQLRPGAGALEGGKRTPIEA